MPAMTALATATIFVSSAVLLAHDNINGIITAAKDAITTNWAAVNMQQERPWADFIIGDEVGFETCFRGQFRSDRFIVRCTAENNMLTILTLDEATSDFDGSAQGE